MQRNAQMTEDFEKMLTELSKPEVNELRHQHLLADHIIRTKNRNILSFWWLTIPIYIIATLVMKTLYMKTSLKQEINLFKKDDPILYVFMLLVLPALIIILNTFFYVKRSVAATVLIILSSIILFIYILSRYV